MQQSTGVCGDNINHVVNNEIPKVYLAIFSPFLDKSSCCMDNHRCRISTKS